LRYIDEPLPICILHPDEFHDLQVSLGEYMKEQLKEMYQEPEQKLSTYLL
jgi:hypothetical protein